MLRYYAMLALQGNQACANIYAPKVMQSGLQGIIKPSPNVKLRDLVNASIPSSNDAFWLVLVDASRLTVLLFFSYSFPFLFERS